MLINNDGNLDIATGKSRTTATWKNRQMMWSEILTRVSQTHRTAETFAEYMASDRNRQDEVKDVGGYVGGYLTRGRRKPDSVAHRQLITLDLDQAKADSWFIITQMLDCAVAIYSTHKHAPDTPRFRLLIPLDREVFTDEYQAIARRIAGDIGIEAFDNTGFQPSRLMYWPSTSKDGEFIFEYQDGPWLCADEVLARYHDWKDSSSWPLSVKVNKHIDRLKKKQGDPLAKPGVVGAWCRTYNIHEVIEKYLPDVYERCDQDDRYTYKEGSTSAGLIVYDDVFAYSHHGTDPISGKLCNAFDLVRLHKFGLRDEDAREGTPGNKLPSYTDMIRFATEDPTCRRHLGEEKIKEAFADFDDSYAAEADEETDTKWLEKMQIDGKGKYLSTINNILLVLKNDPRLKDRIGLNIFENRSVLLKDLPWKKLTAETRYLQDRDDANLRHYLETHYGISSASKISDAIEIVCSENRFHPIREYIEGLKWDGYDRVDSLLVAYLGAEDNLYVRTVTRKTLVAAVARVFEPGIKFDNMLITVGPEGIGKSTLIDKLGSPWFSDSFSFHMLGTKQADEQIQGAWLVEVSELSGLPKADIEAAKSFLSKREDRFRVAYGKRVDFFPRQCVFFGSTNRHRPIKDEPGNRRFWIVLVNPALATRSVFDDLSDYEKGQIWAEAYSLYMAGEELHLSDEVKKIAAQVLDVHTDADDRTGLIREYLEMDLPEKWDEMTPFERRQYCSEDPDMRAVGVHMRTQICAAEIWCELFDGRFKEMTSHNTKFIHEILQKIAGWQPSKGNRKFANYGYQRCYIRSLVDKHSRWS